MKLNLSKHISNQELGEIFGFIGEVLALQGADRFRIRAYQNAAVVIEQQPEPLHEMFLNNPDFDKLPGIGAVLNAKLVELFTTGNVKALQEYVQDIPENVFILSKVPGIGAKRASLLISTFKLEDSKNVVQDLLKVAKDGQIRRLPVFGEKSELQLITMLENFQEKKRMPLSEAEPIALQLKQELEKCEGINRVEVLGSLRRKSPTVGDIDLGVAANSPKIVKDCLEKLPLIKRVVAFGEGSARVKLQDEHQVDIKFAPFSEWGSFLQHFTGSKEHNIRLRELAIKQGKSLSEHGIKMDGTQKKFASEEDFYAELGLKWVPPQERVGGEEINRYRM
jgi:DNA polymerase (family 10)